MSEYTQIGFTTKAHGLKGEVKIKIEKKYREDIEQAEVIFLDIQGRPIPFFLEYIEWGANMRLKLEDVNDRKQSEAISSKVVSIFTKDLVPTLKREVPLKSTYELLIGYNIVNESGELIGKIEGIETYPNQQLAIISHNEKQVLIPLNKTFISKIDNERQKIIMCLPEGILDL